MTPRPARTDFTDTRAPERRPGPGALRLGLAVLLVGGLLADGLWAQAQTLTVSRTKVTPDPEQEEKLPKALRDLGWDQNMGGALPMDVPFLDHEGNQVRLGDFFGEKPVLIAPVYYECPMLCSLVLDGVVRGVKPLKFVPGEQFEIVAISFDDRETPESAERSRKTAVSRYGGSTDASGGWHFLTGDRDSIDRVMDAIGFKFEWDESTGQFAHAGGIVLATPEGKISRYFYGVDYASRDLRLGFVEAADEKIGNVVDQVLLFCYQYDPSIGKYSALTLRLVRIGGILTVLLLAGWLIYMFRRERRRREAREAHA